MVYTKHTRNIITLNLAAKLKMHTFPITDFNEARQMTTYKQRDIGQARFLNLAVI